MPNIPPCSPLTWPARHQHIDNSYDTMQVLSHYSSVQIPCSQSGDLELENEVTEWKNTLEEHALSLAKRRKLQSNVSKRQSLCPDEDDANDKARAEASLREVRAYQFVKLQTPRNSRPSDSLIDK